MPLASSLTRPRALASEKSRPPSSPRSVRRRQRRVRIARHFGSASRADPDNDFLSESIAGFSCPDEETLGPNGQVRQVPLEQCNRGEVPESCCVHVVDEIPSLFRRLMLIPASRTPSTAKSTSPACSASRSRSWAVPRERSSTSTMSNASCPRTGLKTGKGGRRSGRGRAISRSPTHATFISLALFQPLLVRLRPRLQVPQHLSQRLLLPRRGRVNERQLGHLRDVARTRRICAPAQICLVVVPNVKEDPRVVMTFFFLLQIFVDSASA